jgi:DNA-binding winged helix-turn-helix (wHTH) protein
VDQTKQLPRRLKFGCFEADVRSGELTKQAKLLRLQEQPFRLLVMLLERPAELVTREEVRQRLWPQAVVDFDHGVNKAISKIRDALGDSAENPRFVETVARHGYRFLADGLSVRPVGLLAIWAFSVRDNGVSFLCVLGGVARGVNAATLATAR